MLASTVPALGIEFKLQFVAKFQVLLLLLLHVFVVSWAFAVPIESNPRSTAVVSTANLGEVGGREIIDPSK
jgi:hypothetical protein